MGQHIDSMPILPDLQTLLTQLKGQPFQFFRVAYGDELRLHLGNLQGYSNPKMRGRNRGSYILGARASSWVVFSASKSTLLASDHLRVRASNVVARRVDIKKIEEQEYIDSGSIVVDVNLVHSYSGFTLQFVFSDGSTAFIGPNPETSEKKAMNMEISDWEVLTPHSRVLSVGPGERWCYLDSTTKWGE